MERSMEDVRLPGEGGSSQQGMQAGKVATDARQGQDRPRRGG